MSMVLQTEPRTRAALLALPDDGCRHELVSGEYIVTPAPSLRHERVLMRLLAVLLPHVATHQLGELFGVAADLTLGEDEVLQPDIFLLPTVLAATSSWDDAPRPTLVIEIISPSSARTDRQTKRRRYQRAGVPSYWVVDPEQQQIEVWRPDAEAGEVWRERLVWAVPADAPLTIDLGKLFS